MRAAPAYLLASQPSRKCVHGLRKEIRKPLSVLASAWCCINCMDCSLQRKVTYASLRQGKEDACGIQTGEAATMGHDIKSRNLGGRGVSTQLSPLVSSRGGDAGGSEWHSLKA